jgi:hypothetical protein
MNSISITEKEHSNKFLLLLSLIISIVYSLVITNASSYYGSLAVPIPYDDVSYLYNSIIYYNLFFDNSFFDFIHDILMMNGKSHFFFFQGFLSHLIFGISDSGPYFMNFIHIFVLLFFIIKLFSKESLLIIFFVIISVLSISTVIATVYFYEPSMSNGLYLGIGMLFTFFKKDKVTKNKFFNKYIYNYDIIFYFISMMVLPLSSPLIILIFFLATLLSRILISEKIDLRAIKQAIVITLIRTSILFAVILILNLPYIEFYYNYYTAVKSKPHLWGIKVTWFENILHFSFNSVLTVTRKFFSVELYYYLLIILLSSFLVFSRKMNIEMKSKILSFYIILITIFLIVTLKVSNIKHSSVIYFPLLIITFHIINIMFQKVIKKELYKVLIILPLIILSLSFNFNNKPDDLRMRRIQNIQSAYNALINELVSYGKTKIVTILPSNIEIHERNIQLGLLKNSVRSKIYRFKDSIKHNDLNYLNKRADIVVIYNSSKKIKIPKYAHKWYINHHIEDMQDMLKDHPLFIKANRIKINNHEQLIIYKRKPKNNKNSKNL